MTLLQNCLQTRKLALIIYLQKFGIQTLALAAAFSVTQSLFCCKIMYDVTYFQGLSFWDAD
jgi:hypothetical protein